MQKYSEHFGVSTENIELAQKSAKIYERKFEFHTFVPTRKEVLSLPIAQLTPLLVGWMIHSPAEILPSCNQIEQVIEILEQRDKRPALNRLIEMCRYYVSGN